MSADVAELHSSCPRSLFGWHASASSLSSQNAIQEDLFVAKIRLLARAVETSFSSALAIAISDAVRGVCTRKHTARAWVIRLVLQAWIIRMNYVSSVLSMCRSQVKSGGEALWYVIFNILLLLPCFHTARVGFKEKTSLLRRMLECVRPPGL